MATVNKIEELKVWQDAITLSKGVISLLERKQIAYGMKDQMIRSAVSISSNIAEGFEYRNPKEFRKFLKFARGSAGELKTQLIISEEIYLSKKETQEFKVSCETIIKKIQSLTNYLNSVIDKSGTVKPSTVNR